MSLSSTPESSHTRKIAQVAMLGAVSAVLMYLQFPIPFIAPPFFHINFAEVPVLTGGFAMGPVAGAMIELIKIVINLIFKGTTTAFISEFASLLMGCSMVVPAAIYYRSNKTRNNAVIALVIGSVCTTIVTTLANAFMTLPAYAKVMGVDISAIVAMGTAVNGSASDLLTFCLYIVAPFNIIKAALASIVTLILYKRLRKVIR